MNPAIATPHRLQTLWPWLAVFASAAMLASAHAFQHLGGMAPCQLCLRQREVYWAAITIGVLGLAATRLWPKLYVPRATAALLAVAFLAGAAVAIYHAGAEYGFWPAPATCGQTRTGAVTLDDLNAVLAGGKQTAPRCDEAPWSLFGISMAGYNALISLVLAAISLALTFVPGRAPEAAE